MNIISINPEIYTIDNFLSEDECNHFINISKDKMKRSVVTGVNQGILSAGRTGSNTWIPHNYDSITYKVACNIAKLIGIEISNAEAYQVIHYKEGEEYKQHYDSFTHEKTAKNIRCMKLGGQRMKTALCYLNNVEEGGSTQFTKINENIYPKIGKMLVFSNVNKNTNKRHVLSEHAAMPVLKGEKWAFNLWFREFNRNTEFDLSTYAEENIPSNINDTLSDSKLDSKLDPILIPKDLIIDKTINKKIDNNNSKKYSFSVLSNENEIFIIKNVLDDNLTNKIRSLVNIDESVERKTYWLKHNQIPELSKKISDITSLPSDFFESIQVVKYDKNNIHNNFFDAYDIGTEKGIKNTKILGQRLITIVGFLSENTEYNFPKLDIQHKACKNSIMIYNNVNNDHVRKINMLHTIKNSNTNGILLFNIYLREKSRNNKIITIDECRKIISKKYFLNNSNNLSLKNDDESHAKSILHTVYNNFNEGKIVNHKDFNFLNKVNNKDVMEISQTLYKLHKENSNSILNLDNLNINYNFDELNPVIIKNVFHDDIIISIQEYFRKSINESCFQLGDRQSNRYKSHNETLTRILHYELLPLIEKITNKNLTPTYTYLSCYIKGADLPAHTDREDCEYTVSYIIDKPFLFSWPIYLHKIKQEEKHKGRYDFTPDKSECLSLDCDANGLMIFQGTDHIHYREKLESDFYNIVLLHYKSN